MNVVFGKLEIHNFMSIVDLEFDFDSPSYRGVNLILGENTNTYSGEDGQADNTVGADSSNGAGKSTLFAALCFALYGDSIKHTEAALIPNRSVDPKEPVSLCLSLSSDERRYRIIRTLTGKTRKTTLTVVEMQADGTEVDVTLSTVKLTQSFISNKIVGCGMSIFLRSVLLRNDPSNNFFALEKSAKVKFIEELFDLGVFTEMYSQIHRDKLDRERELYGFGQVKISLDRNLASAKASFDGWKDDGDAELDAKRARRDEAYAALQEKESELNALVDEVTKGRAALEKLEARFPAQREKVNALYRKLQSMKSDLVVCGNDVTHADKLLATHHKTRDILCDDCRGKFDALVHFGDIEAKKSEATAKADGIKSAMEGVSKEYETENGKLSKGDAILAKRKSEFLALQGREARSRAEVKALKSEIASLDAALSAPRKKKENPYTALVAKAEAELAANSAKMAESETKVRKLAMLEGVVSPDTIRNIVISGLVNELNSRIKYYLQRMGATYTCIFDSSLDYKFVTTTGETGYGNFSKGEEMRLSVATTFAFRDFMLVRINTRTNLLLVDEYLDSSLDRLAKRGIMTMFAEFVADNKDMGVFLITHDEYIKGMDFASVLKFVKNGDVSTLEVDLH